ncbi:PREDICTED: F-box/kelch-repeat protein At2g43445-like [Camelina sativa]|uniref:F-box/kelch-repeat protein At2g43445-like n=1 Tax=Camelina sativa TaxID=90675 RepID=A0ABM0XEN1_CAMSA|nr:PREDICTED: F-box/kelch-repeat protein At2g43445-like [Camelina sativa]
MREEEVNPNSSYVPSHLLKEIFLRLPLKSLVKFKTVSKEWRSILESNRFVEMHLSFQKSDKSCQKILAAHHCYCGAPLPSVLSGVRFKGDDEEVVYLHCESTRPSMSCDGLVCIPVPGWVTVLNPSTGQLRRFLSGPDPVPSGNWAMGFGRVKGTGSYKVVRMFFNPNHYEILDVNIGEWRKLSPPPYEVDAGRRSACVNGSIYWLKIWRGCKLLALDLQTLEYHDVPLPSGMRFKMETQIVNLDDHLAIATTRLNSDPEWQLDIWTMDAGERWSKTYSISLASLGTNPLEPRWFRPVIVSKDGNVVIYDDKKKALFRCYQRTDTIRQIFSYNCVISPYLENIVRLQNEQVKLRFACIFEDGMPFIAHVVSSFQPRVYKLFCKGKGYTNSQIFNLMALEIWNVYD